MTELLIAILATFRLVRLLVWDDGPGDVFKRLREKAGIRIEEGPPPIKIVEERFWAKFLSCYWCVGVWVGILVTILVAIDSSILDYLLFALAIAGGSAILDSTLRSLGE